MYGTQGIKWIFNNEMKRVFCHLEQTAVPLKALIINGIQRFQYAKKIILKIQESIPHQGFFVGG
ncbi:hypothetical protein LD39_10565 [Halobacillus sp. BBL2006]|nr:hypothetical protein LD39_10565 [Halobacillus sp. BBL2006]